MAMEEDAGRGYCYARRESTLKYVLYGGNFLTRPSRGTLRHTILNIAYIARASGYLLTHVKRGGQCGLHSPECHGEWSRLGIRIVG